MFVARIGARAALVAGVCAVGLLAGAGSALAEEAKFTYTGKEQEFEVPAGVTSVEVVAVGSQGESAAGLGGAGGVGAIVAGKLTVKPEQALYVEVGGVPFNGGGASEPVAISSTELSAGELSTGWSVSWSIGISAS